MIKNKRYIFWVTVSLLVLVFGFFYFSHRYRKDTPPIDYTTQIKSADENKINEPEKPNTKNIEKDELPVFTSEDFKKINVSLIVFDRKYDINVKEGSSVFELMGDLKKQDNLFDFKFTEHKGMGSFITEINGTKGTVGKYWIYYVNDKLASIGVSKFILKDGDIINWKNEGM